jgi:hypothetical protein
MCPSSCPQRAALGAASTAAFAAVAAAAAAVSQAMSPGWSAVRSLVKVNIANWQAQEAVSRRWKQPSKPPTWEDVIMMVRPQVVLRG